MSRSPILALWAPAQRHRVGRRPLLNAPRLQPGMVSACDSIGIIWEPFLFPEGDKHYASKLAGLDRVRGLAIVEMVRRPNGVTIALARHTLSFGTVAAEYVRTSDFPFGALLAQGDDDVPNLVITIVSVDVPLAGASVELYLDADELRVGQQAPDLWHPWAVPYVV